LGRFSSLASGTICPSKQVRRPTACSPSTALWRVCPGMSGGVLAWPFGRVAWSSQRALGHSRCEYGDSPAERRGS
jgi:hypothetical protein